MLAHLENGDAVEVGVFGRGAMSGSSNVFGTEGGDVEAKAQAPGTALPMNTAALHEKLWRILALRALLLRQGLVPPQAGGADSGLQRRHHTGQRLARWLLLAQDRAEGGRSRRSASSSPWCSGCAVPESP